MACCGTREPYPRYMYVFEVLSAEIIIMENLFVFLNVQL